jgi:hypothetical protein
MTGKAATSNSTTIACRTSITSAKLDKSGRIEFSEREFREKAQDAGRCDYLRLNHNPALSVLRSINPSTQKQSWHTVSRD